MKLEEITAGRSLADVEPAEIVTVVATVPLGDGALQLIYRTPDSGGRQDRVRRWSECVRRMVSMVLRRTFIAAHAAG